MALALVAATVLSYAIGWFVNVPVLVPVLNTAASYPFMVLALRRGDLRLAVARMLLWALTMGVCAMLLSYARPAATGTLFLRGDAYRAEMFEWVLTGRGAESSPSRFIPQQLGQAAIFAGLTLATAGALSMPMGAVLMNYMGHYVGTLASRSARPLLTMLLAWHPWSVIRIVSFVILGVVLSVPVLSRVMRITVGGPERAALQPRDIRTDRRRAGLSAFAKATADRRSLGEGWLGSPARRFVTAACVGLLVDIVMKALLAPAWQRLLLRTVGW